MRRVTATALAVLVSAATGLTASCGGGGNGGIVDCSSCGYPVTYVGTVSGLAPGTSVVLHDPAGTGPTISANGNFIFANPAALPRVPPQLGVLIQPAGQRCTAGNSAFDANGSVTVTVACATLSGMPASLLALYAGMEHSGNADGTAAAAGFQMPQALATDQAGNVYVADTFNSTIRKIAPGGVVSTLAGTPGVLGSGDGTGASAGFFWPQGITVDGSGNVYVADTLNSTIRVITPAGIVSTLAGKAGVRGSDDGAGALASFSMPEGIGLDPAGNLYVADALSRTIRKVTPAGIVTTLAGTAGAYGSNDGTGAAAQFELPQSLAVDGAGNIFVTDGATRIRMITPGGAVTTLAVPAGAFGQLPGIGIGILSVPRLTLTVDGAGNLYAAGTTSGLVSKILPAGTVMPVLGTGGQYAFNAGPLPGSLLFPQALAVHAGDLYISVNSGVAVAHNVP